MWISSGEAINVMLGGPCRLEIAGLGCAHGSALGMSLQDTEEGQVAGRNVAGAKVQSDTSNIQYLT
jgi:hypothetical protein